MTGKTMLPTTYNFVQDVLTPGRVTAVIGGKFFGKSFFATQLSFCVGDWYGRTDFLGYYTPHTRVLYLDVDTRRDLDLERIHHMSFAFECDEPTLYRADPHVIVRDVQYSEGKIDDLYDMVIREYSDFRPGLIVIDPVWMLANEEDKASVAHLYEKLRSLCAYLSCAVLFTHFPGGGYMADPADIKIDLGARNIYDFGTANAMYEPRDVLIETRQVRDRPSSVMSGLLPTKIAFRYPVFERPVKGRTYRGEESYIRRH